LLAGRDPTGISSNNYKAAVLWGATGRWQHHLAPERIGSDVIATFSPVRDIGKYLDADISMKSPKCFAILELLSAFVIQYQSPSIRR
jgi:hypothetical protein